MKAIAASLFSLLSLKFFIHFGKNTLIFHIADSFPVILTTRTALCLTAKGKPHQPSSQCGLCIHYIIYVGIFPSTNCPGRLELSSLSSFLNRNCEGWDFWGFEGGCALWVCYSLTVTAFYYFHNTIIYQIFSRNQSLFEQYGQLL